MIRLQGEDMGSSVSSPEEYTLADWQEDVDCRAEENDRLHVQSGWDDRGAW